jgi:hypothetical protein
MEINLIWPELIAAEDMVRGSILSGDLERFVGQNKARVWLYRPTPGQDTTIPLGVLDANVREGDRIDPAKILTKTTSAGAQVLLTSEQMRVLFDRVIGICHDLSSAVQDFSNAVKEGFASSQAIRDLRQEWANLSLPAAPAPGARQSRPDSSAG